MPEPLLVAKAEDEIYLLPRLANRHGLIAGATGTGKTVTLQRLAEAFSRIGVPVFMADVKGDLVGAVASRAQPTRKVKERIAQLGLNDFAFEACPVVFWDVFGDAGPSGARHDFRDGAAAAGAHAESQRHAAGRADPGVQDRRRQQACCCST